MRMQKGMPSAVVGMQVGIPPAKLGAKKTAAATARYGPVILCPLAGDVAITPSPGRAAVTSPSYERYPAKIFTTPHPPSRAVSGRKPGIPAPIGDRVSASRGDRCGSAPQITFLSG
uniref:Uncharacterized protein n=1 Tax=Eutreptiella gymnastica TaxID=73025 RepID=A0A7S4LL56_9EUGL